MTSLIVIGPIYSDYVSFRSEVWVIDDSTLFQTLFHCKIYTISTEQKGNVAWTNWSCDVIHLIGMSDVILLYYTTLHSTLQPTLQPLHHQPTSLTYGGAQAMDVTDGDKTWVPSKGEAPQRLIVKRSIGQWDRTWDNPWNRGCPEKKINQNEKCQIQHDLPPKTQIVACWWIKTIKLVGLNRERINGFVLIFLYSGHPLFQG